MASSSVVLAESGVLVVLVALVGGLAGAALAFISSELNEARKQKDARLFRNQEERRRTGADYLVALDAYRRGVRDRLPEPQITELARRHVDLVQRMNLYFDRDVRERVDQATDVVVEMHQTLLRSRMNKDHAAGPPDVFESLSEADEQLKRLAQELVSAMRRQLGEPDD